MTTDKDLQPCPFCGEPPETCGWDTMGGAILRIFCDTAGCCAAKMEGDAELIVDEWNRDGRSYQPRTPDISKPLTFEEIEGIILNNIDVKVYTDEETNGNGLGFSTNATGCAEIIYSRLPDISALVEILRPAELNLTSLLVEDGFTFNEIYKMTRDAYNSVEKALSTLKTHNSGEAV